MSTTRDMDNYYGAMITASHNPYYFNGIKIFTKEGYDADIAFTSLLEQKIEEVTEIKRDFKSQLEYVTNKEVAEEKIHVTGIPVSEKFTREYNREEVCNLFDLNPNNDVVLFFAGGEFGLVRKTTILMLKALIRLFSKLQVVAVSGRNPKMNEKFQTLVNQTE
jgi:phosphomannomutase